MAGGKEVMERSRGEVVVMLTRPRYYEFLGLFDLAITNFYFRGVICHFLFSVVLDSSFYRVYGFRIAVKSVEGTVLLTRPRYYEFLDCFDIAITNLYFGFLICHFLLFVVLDSLFYRVYGFRIAVKSVQGIVLFTRPLYYELLGLLYLAITIF